MNRAYIEPFKSMDKVFRTWALIKVGFSVRMLIFAKALFCVCIRPVIKKFNLFFKNA